MKFLKGKVWAIVLAIVALVAILCVTASAAEHGLVELYLGTYDIDLNQGDTLYFKTTSSGTITKSETAIDDWNIKLEFAEGNDAVPTMTLRDAALNDQGGRYASLVSQSNTEDKFRIIVEKIENPTVKTVRIEGVLYSHDDADSLFAHGIKWYAGELEIRGYTGDTAPTNPDELGRLTMQTAYNSINADSTVDITFDHVNLVMKNIATDSTRNCIESPGLVTFNGGTARLTSFKGYAITKAAGGILFTGNVDAELKSTKNQTVTYTAPSKFIVESGNVSVISEETIAINSTKNGGSLIVNGGTFTIHAGNYLSEGTDAVVYSGYKNPDGDSLSYRRISENYDGTGDVAYSTGMWGGKKYFKIEPAYSIAVDGGSASMIINGTATTVTQAPKDTTITLTATPAANQTFSGWEVVGPDGFDTEDITPTGEGTAEFVMPAGKVSVKAKYITTAKMILRGTEYEFSSAVPAYFTTDSNGAETRIPDADLPQDGSEPNYNIKLAFDKNGIPTVYLKGARIAADDTAIQNGDYVQEFAIVTEVAENKIDTGSDMKAEDGRDDRYVDSYITHAHTSTIDPRNPTKSNGTLTNSTGNAVKTSVKVTFSGEGLLKTESKHEDGNSIYSTVAHPGIYFDHANVAIKNSLSKAWDDEAFRGSPSNIVFNGGKFSVQSYYIPFLTSDSTTITAKNNADVHIYATSTIFYYGKLVVDNANVYAEGFGNNTSSAVSHIINVTDIKILNNATFEVKNTGSTGALWNKKPSELYDGYYAVAGPTKETATANYYEQTGLSGTLENKSQNCRYFKVGPKATVIVENGTAKSPYGEGEGKTINAIAGDTVTLTATLLEGQRFVEWTIGENAPAGFTFDTTQAVTSVTLPAGSVNLTGVAKREEKVYLRGDLYTITETPAYYTTDGDGKIIAATEDTYTIKLAFNGGVATVYLKNANLSYADTVIENGPDTSLFAIETEAPSTLFQTGYGDFSDAEETFAVVKASGKVIFRGDDLLTMKGYINGIFGVSSAEVLFEDANVAITKIAANGESNHGGWYEQALYGSFKSITFSGGTATLSASRILCSASGTITVTDNAKVTMKALSIASYGGPQFNVENGYLYLEANTSNYALLNTTGVSVYENGILEIFNTNAGGKIFEKQPELFDGNFAVMGDSEATATVYSGTGELDGKYFKVGKPVTVTVTNGTAKSFDLPSVADPENENLHTLTTLAGSKVTLTAKAESNMMSIDWIFAKDSLTPTIKDNTFTMPDGPVSVTPVLEEFVTIKLYETDYSFTENMPLYFTTNGTATIKKVDPTDAYNIKLAFDDDGVPTVYLNGANIVDGNWKKIIENGANVTKYAIETEAPSQITFTGAAVRSSCETIFRGASKLTLTSKADGQSAISAAMGTADLTFENANLEITTIGTGSSIYGTSGKIIFDGATVKMISAYAALFNGCSNGLELKNNANVHIEATRQALYIQSCPSVTVDSGSLYISSCDNFLALKDGGQLIVNGGTVELVSTGIISSKTSATVNVNYADALAVAGTSKNAATPYTNGAALSGVSYFKVAPAYQVSVTGGTAKMLGISGGSIKAFAGEDVTMTPATEAGMGFAYWTSADLDVEKAYDANYVFEMPAHAVAIEATLGKSSQISVGGKVHEAVQGGKVLYYTTSTAGAWVAGGDEQSYNVKFIYPMGNDAEPTVYLRDAYVAGTIASGTNTAKTTKFIVQKGDGYVATGETTSVEADCYYTGGAITWGKGDLIIEGETQQNGFAKLVMKSGVTMDSQNLTFKNLDMKCTVAASIFTGKPVWITFDGGKYNLESGSLLYHMGSDNTGIIKGLKVTGGADADFVSTGSMVFYSTPTIPAGGQQLTKPHFVIENGDVYVEARKNSCLQTNGVGDFFSIQKGSLEMVNTSEQSGHRIGIGKVVVDDYTNSEDINGAYYAVGGTSEETATYITNVSSFSGSKYFKLVPAYVINVEGGKVSGVAKIPEGMEVTKTFTGNIATEGDQGVKYWESTAWPSGTEVYDEYTFTMPGHSITVTPVYDKAAHIKIGGTTYEAVRGGKVNYFTTTSTGTLSSGNAQNYNVMFVYPETTGAVPTVYLRDAYISGAIANGPITPAKTNIVVQKTDATTNVNGENANYDAYFGSSLTWTGGDLEILGDGGASNLSKLKSLSTFAMTGVDLTFTDLDLIISTAGNVFAADHQWVTFNGGSADITGSVVFYAGSSTNERGIRITNNASVTTKSTSFTVYSHNKVNYYVIMESGQLHMTRENGKLAQLGNTDCFKINGGTVIMESNVSLIEGDGVAKLSGYNDPAGNTYRATVIQAGTTNESEYKGDRLDTYKYLKVEPAYSITVNGGSSDWHSAPAGETVTLKLSPSDVPSDQGLAYWQSQQVGKLMSETQYFTFTMPEQPVTLEAVLGDYAYVLLNKQEYSVIQGGLPKYFKTNGTALTADGTSGAYNVKFAYAADDGEGDAELPTLTLKDASWTNDEPIKSSNKTLDLAIEVLGENHVISSSQSAIYFTGDNLTLFGGGSLEVAGTNNPFMMRGRDDWDGSVSRKLVFDDIDFTARLTGDGVGCVRFYMNYAWEVTDSSITLSDIDAGDHAVYCEGSRAYTFTNTDILITSVTYGLHASTQGTILIDRCNVQLGTAESMIQTAFLGNVTIKDSFVEAYTTSGLGSKIALSGDVDNYVAVAAESRDAFVAAPEDSLYYSMNDVTGKKYFRIEPKVVQVQITWGAMSFTYSGTIWNVDTMSWEGNWVPSGEGETQLDMWWNTTEEKWDSAEVTDAESLDLDSNQIRVENTGTETFIVKFDFTAAEDFATNETNLRGTFVDASNEAIGEDGCTVVRFAEADAFLKLNSAAVAGFADGTVLGVVTVVIDAVTPAQGGNA